MNKKQQNQFLFITLGVGALYGIYLYWQVKPFNIGVAN